LKEGGSDPSVEKERKVVPVPVAVPGPISDLGFNVLYKNA
jgi:hypothetical protein